MPVSENRLYESNKLNMWFAISSILMTASLLWLIKVDHVRPWRDFQKEYYKGVESDIYQVLLRRATEVGPAVDLNDLKACDTFDVMDEVKNISLPTQVVCGSEDVMTPVKYSNYLAGNIKNAREEIIPGGSHFVQLERYQQVNEQIERFLATLK